MLQNKIAKFVFFCIQVLYKFAGFSESRVGTYHYINCFTVDQKNQTNPIYCCMWGRRLVKKKLVEEKRKHENWDSERRRPRGEPTLSTIWWDQGAYHSTSTAPDKGK